MRDKINDIIYWVAILFFIGAIISLMFSTIKINNIYQEEELCAMPYCYNYPAFIEIKVENIEARIDKIEDSLSLKDAKETLLTECLDRLPKLELIEK